MVDEVVVDLSGDGALETAHDVELGQALVGAPLHIDLGGLMAVHTDQGDAPQGMVGVAIATPVKAVTIGPPRGGGQRGHATQPREGGLAAQPPRVVPSGHQQLPSGVQANAGQGQQRWRGRADQLGELDIEGVQFRLQVGQRRARVRRALVADSGSRRGPGRRARQARASALVVWERRGWLRSSWGAA